MSGASLRLGATVFGDPLKDPLVVLLHGGGQTRHAWGGLGHRLAASGYAAVALDARGHGESDWSDDGDYSQDAQLDDLVTVLGQLPRPAALVGASMGGITSLLAAGEGRADVWGLVLVDVVPRLEPKGAKRIMAFMSSNPEGFASIDEVAEAVADYLPNRTRPPDPAGLAKNLRRDPDGRLRWHWDPRFLERVSLHPPDANRARAAARGVHAPTLLVRGALSDVVSVAGAEEFLSLVPGAEFVDVQDAGHMVAGDDNDRFGSTIIDFLRRYRPDPVRSASPGPGR